MKHWTTFGVAPPEQGASRLERMKFVRDLVLRYSGFNLLIGVVAALLIAKTWFTLVALGVVLVGLLDVAYLTWRVRRMRRS